jgi:hypothetical protein
MLYLLNFFFQHKTFQFEVIKSMFHVVLMLSVTYVFCGYGH